MTDRTSRVLSIILAFVFVALIAGVYVWESKGQSAFRQSHEEYLEKTADYQKEREELVVELTELEKDVVYCGDSTKLMVGFFVSSASDIDIIREKAQQHGISPIIIVDGTMSYFNIDMLIESADPSWEIMLYSPSLTSTTGGSFALNKAQLETDGRRVSNVAFLRIQGISSADIAMLKGVGFTGYTVYHDIPLSGQSDDGSVYFDFSRITTGSVNISDRLIACRTNNASMIYAFEMSSVRAGTISSLQLDNYLETVIEAARQEGTSFATTAETVTSLSRVNQVKVQLEVSRARETADVRARIKELDGLIADIYDECFGK